MQRLELCSHFERKPFIIKIVIRSFRDIIRIKNKNPHTNKLMIPSKSHVHFLCFTYKSPNNKKCKIIIKELLEATSYSHLDLSHFPRLELMRRPFFKENSAISIMYLYIIDLSYPCVISLWWVDNFENIVCRLGNVPLMIARN
jgi:hypothetical protein